MEKNNKLRFPTTADNIFGSCILVLFAWFFFAFGQELNLFDNSKLIFIVILIVVFILGYIVHMKLTPDRDHLLASLFTASNPKAINKMPETNNSGGENNENKIPKAEKPERKTKNTTSKTSSAKDSRSSKS